MVVLQVSCGFVIVLIGGNYLWAVAVWVPFYLFGGCGHCVYVWVCFGLGILCVLGLVVMITIDLIAVFGVC